MKKKMKKEKVKLRGQSQFTPLLTAVSVKVEAAPSVSSWYSTSLAAVPNFSSKDSICNVRMM